MSLTQVYEKLAAADEEIGEMQKIASHYDAIGRSMAQQMLKEARKLPPGMFSGKAGVMKLLGAGALGGGGYMAGKARAKGQAEKDDVAIAQKAYHAGVQRGAHAVIQKLRSMGMK